MTEPKKNAAEEMTEVQKMVERAKAREAQTRAARERIRKAAPADVVMAAPTYVDVRKELVKLYAPECLPKRDPNDPRKIVKAAERSPFFAPRVDILKWVNKGYVPVLDEDGEYVQDEDDVLFTRDAETTREELERARLMSDARVKGYDAKAAEAGVKEEQIEVTTSG